MPEQDTQQKNKRPELITLLGEFDKFIKTAVTREEMLAALQGMAEGLKKVEKRITDSMAQNKDESNLTIQDVRNEIQNAIAQAESALGEAKEETSQSLAQAVQQLHDDVKRVEMMIPPETDLSDLYSKLQQHETRMDETSTLQKAENVRNALEMLEGDERLKATAIDGLEELMTDYQETKKTVTRLQGASMTPSPLHTPRHDRFVMNGTDTTVTLTEAPGAQGNAIFALRYNGQVQDLDTDYTVNGNKITFVTFTPDDGSVISVTYTP